MSVTDHDTMASVGPATAAAAVHGMTVVPGHRDHGRPRRARRARACVFPLRRMRRDSRSLLTTQRRNRVERAREIADRLAALGAPIDVAPLIEGAAKDRRKGAGASADRTRPHRSRPRRFSRRGVRHVPVRRSPAYVPHRGRLARRRRRAGHCRRRPRIARAPRAVEEGRDHSGARDSGPRRDRGVPQLPRSPPRRRTTWRWPNVTAPA